MTRQSASDIGKKYANRAANAVPEYKAGVMAVTEAPAQKAIAQQDKMRTKILASIDSGKWRRSLEKVTLQVWKDATAVKGGDRYATGVRAAEGKMTSFMTEFLPHLQAGLSKIANMPSVTQEDNIARMVAMVRHNAEFRSKA